MEYKKLLRLKIKTSKTFTHAHSHAHARTHERERERVKNFSFSYLSSCCNCLSFVVCRHIYKIYIDKLIHRQKFLFKKSLKTKKNLFLVTLEAKNK